MKTFLAELWFLLPRPLKRAGEESEIRKVVEVLASLFDDLKTAAFNVRRAWHTATAHDIGDGLALDIIGADRNLRRYPGESNVDYQARLERAWELYQAGGTVPGMVLAMELIGIPDATVLEPRVRHRCNGVLRANGASRIGSLQWASFHVAFEMPASLPSERLALILRTIDDWKPSHTMCATLLLQAGNWTDSCEAEDQLAFVSTRSTSSEDLYAWPVPMCNGVYRCNGAIRADAHVDTLSFEVLPA